MCIRDRYSAKDSNGRLLCGAAVGCTPDILNRVDELSLIHIQMCIRDSQCTAYDTNAVSWGNTARESWWYTIKDDFVSGEFIWTGFDYIGEPTPWNGTGKGSVSGDKLAVPNSSYFGVIDTAGFEKDSFYFYTSQWREDKQTLHIVPQLSLIHIFPRIL